MYSILFIVLIFHNAGIVNVSHLPAVTKLFQRGIVFPDLFKSRIFFISFFLHRKNRIHKNMRIRDLCLQGFQEIPIQLCKPGSPVTQK